MADILSAVPTLQGMNSRTFTRPPLDGSLTFPELIAFHAKHSPHHPLYVYPDQGGLRTIHYPEVFRAVREAANVARGYYKRAWTTQQYSVNVDVSSTLHDAPVLGILANSDSITFATLITGIMYCGYTPFPISVRNSATAVVHLVRSTNIHQLFVSPDPAMQRLAQQTLDILSSDGYKLELLPMPQFHDLYNEDVGHESEEKGELLGENTTLILHSSGSTALPKPIRFKTSKFLMWGALLPYYGQVDLCGVTIAVHSLPIFHAMGVLGMLWPVASGAIMAHFQPSSPPVIPTPEAFIASMNATKSEMAFCVPTFVETWARDPANLPILLQQKAIVVAGAPLEKGTGDSLRSQGVKVTSLYGSTEAGVMSMFPPDLSRTEEWEYFKLSGHLDIELVPQENLEDIYEAVILETPPYAPNVTNMEVRGRRAYATSDLLQRHPTKPDYWRIYGRADDQLVLSTGEKTNPAPLEAILRKDPHVAAAIMFGRGRFQNGVLIQPKEPFDPSDEVMLADFRNKIWPSFEKMNDFAPQHSRVFKEMIVVTIPSKPMELTAKGTPRRQVCINAYAEEIGAAYAAVEHSSQTDLVLPSEWTKESVLKFIRTIVCKTLTRTVGDDDDLFQNGCDSLQATWIRNTILNAIRNSRMSSAHPISQNVVYTNPTVHALADYVWDLFCGTPPDTAESLITAKLQTIQDFLHKYGTDFSVMRQPSPGMNVMMNSETVLVTGTTGRLGCHLLTGLLQHPNVVRVYALNRAASGSEHALALRQEQALKQWGLDADLVASQKLSLIACTYEADRLGLNEEDYRKIQSSVTTIIHNAWRVDFNLALSSFEPLIASTRRLIDLALDSPIPNGPHVIFVSSIASLRSYGAPTPAPEKHINDPRVSLGFGYGESKWIAEQMHARATKDTGLKTTVVRVGQLAGDTRIGGWSPKEWVPTIVGAGLALGCLPARDVDVAWIPVDMAALALIDMTQSQEQVLHLVHPHPVSWNTIFKSIGDRFKLDSIAYYLWVDRLRDATDSSLRNGTAVHQGAGNLRQFLENDVEAADIRLATEKSVKSSPVLSNLEPLGVADAMNWVSFWGLDAQSVS